MLAIDDVILRNYHDPLPSSLGAVRLAPISEQADLAEQVGTETLYFCPDAWALRHRFINQDTGEVIRARCDRWNCLYCGPRKTDQWRQLIAAAEPVLHIVLSRAGHTVEEAARALTTWVQFMRRGSKGRGKGRLGARPAYPIEYFAVLERHANFEETGFHWHLLIKGVDFIEKEHLDQSWESATHGLNRFAYIDRVKNNKAVGYVTKYLTKEITRTEKGLKERHREMVELVSNEQGNTVVERVRLVVEQVVSSARRIRYSRHFFPACVEELRFRLFSQLEDPDQIERETSALAETSEQDAVESEVVGQEETPLQRPVWSLHEEDPYTTDFAEYEQRRRQALLESLMVVRAGEWRISGRVLSVWEYQRSQRRRRDEMELTG